jgi:S-DNA-T family DNA segregation ATPase FtsK/SpoIIIE
VWGLLLAAIGLVTIIALVSQTQGRLSEAWSRLLRQGFGVGALPVALLMIAGAVWLLFGDSLRQRVQVRWQFIVGLELFFFAGLGLVHVLAAGDPQELARMGRYGGYVGWSLAELLVPLFGSIVSILFLSALMVVGVLFATGTSWRLVAWRGQWLVAHLGKQLRSAVAQRQRTVRRPAPAPEAVPSATPTRDVTIEQSSPPDTAVAAPAAPAQPEPARRPKSRKRSKKRASSASLPPLDLLATDKSTGGDDADARMRAEIIEETLSAFGIPAQVVEWNRGPSVTQFGVEPGYIEKKDRQGKMRRYKIRVSKILSLTNDLALALAAAPIRIEAPVPGRAIVGIEVPNADKTVVGLRGVLHSKEFKRFDSPLRIALGRDVSGSPVVADLATMPHLLIAGATGTGKSVCLNSIVASLLFQNTPDELKFIMVDPKRVELSNFNGIPHLLSPVVTDMEKVISALRWLVYEMEDRYATFAKAKVRNLAAYNRAAAKNGRDPIPMIVVIVDELADLMLAAADDVERMLCRLAQMARATGIHLVIATQRPSVDVVTGLIKANFPARISFAVTSQVDSRVILDTTGAEKLLGRGDMLYMAPDSPKLQRIQGCFVSPRELKALAAFWRDSIIEEEEEDEDVPPWEESDFVEDDSDRKVVEEAIEIVREHDHASTSFLQRQMRIGYPRAARIIDRLEEMGVVGPQESGGRSREVIHEADAAEGSEEPVEADAEES